MKRTLSVLAAALAAASLALPAAAQDGTLKKIKDSGAITIGHRDASMPFSYYDDKQQPIGYAMDLCHAHRRRGEGRAEDAEARGQLPARHLGEPHPADGERHDRPRVRLDHQQRRAPEAGRGSRITHFVTANRWVAKKSSNIKTLADLKGKTIVSTAGTTNIKQITEINAAQNLGMNIIPANGHPEAFQMVETGRAVAFVMDDILLYSLVAQSRTPADYVISADGAVAVEPYGIMLRKDDPAFKKVVDNAMTQTLQERRRSTRSTTSGSRSRCRRRAST